VHWLLSLTLTDWQHHFLDISTRVIAVAAVLHTVLPPYDWEPDFVSEGLVDFPHLQNAFRKTIHNRYYKLLIYVVGYIAIHARSTLWRSISIKKQLATAISGSQIPTVPPGQ